MRKSHNITFITNDPSINLEKIRMMDLFYIAWVSFRKAKLLAVFGVPDNAAVASHLKAEGYTTVEIIKENSYTFGALIY
jgi:hypothetical protein